MRTKKSLDECRSVFHQRDWKGEFKLYLEESELNRGMMTHLKLLIFQSTPS
jgi:hypothetical protein